MTVFVVLARRSTSELEKNISRAFPDSYFRYSDSAWFISATGTAREVSEKIGAKKGVISGVVVLATTGSYFGVSSPDVWDWLRSAVERGGDG
jgi:hypothetical protein